MELISLDKTQFILQVRSNPNDADIFEFFYCPKCQEIVPAGGLFPALQNQPQHLGHSLVWIPAQDSSLPPLPTEGHILYWLNSYRSQLDSARYLELVQYSTTTNSGNWIWVLRGVEQADWLNYLMNYLEELADAWLAALNGQPSAFFPKPVTLWRNNEAGETNISYFKFEWKKIEENQNDFLNLINPAIR